MTDQKTEKEQILKFKWARIDNESEKRLTDYQNIPPFKVLFEGFNLNKSHKATLKVTNVSKET